MQVSSIKSNKNFIWWFIFTSQFIVLTVFAESLSPNIEVLMSGNRLKQEIDASNKVIRPVGQLKKAGVTLQNMSRNLYHLEYKADWYDDFSQIVSSGTWQRFTLPPNSGKGIVSLGKTPESARVVFQLRLPDDETIRGKYFKQSLRYENADNATLESER